MRDLKFGVDLLQRLRRALFVEGLEDRLALGGARSSIMSARSAGCSLARRSEEIFSRTRRAGSVSIRLTNSQGIGSARNLFQQGAKSGRRHNVFQEPADGSARADIDRADLKTACRRRLAFAVAGSTSLTRTTLRPCTSMIC